MCDLTLQKVKQHWRRRTDLCHNRFFTEVPKACAPCTGAESVLAIKNLCLDLSQRIARTIELGLLDQLEHHKQGVLSLATRSLMFSLRPHINVLCEGK